MNGTKQTFQEEFRKELFSLKNLFEQQPHAMAWKSKNGVYLQHNRKYLHYIQHLISGSPLNITSLCNKTDFDILPKKFAKKFNQQDLLVLKSNQEEIFFDPYKIIRCPFYDNTGNIQGIFVELMPGAYFDLEEIIALIPGNIYWKNKQGRYLGCNNNVAKILHLNSREEIINKTDYDMMEAHYADLVNENDQFIFKNNQEVRLEEIGLDIKGNPAVYVTIKTPLHDKHNNVIGLLGASYDITKLKQTEEELLIAKHNLEIANKVKSEFLANMGHDIRTPLTGILGLTESLQQQATTKKQKSTCELLTNAAQELLKLFNDIIEVISIETKEDPLTVNKPFNIQQIIDHNLTLLKPAAYNKKLKLTAIYAPDIKKNLIGNPIYLDRIILNLISNSIKFTHQGYVKIMARTEMIDQDHVVLIMDIEDTGIGIPKDKQGIIFEYFSRLSPSYQGIYKGSGIGLYTVKQNLKTLRGNITVDSEPGKGSIFTVTIPLTIDHEQDKIEEIDQSITQIQEPVFIPPRPLRVLLVEDNELAAQSAQNTLLDLASQVDIAVTGNDALTLSKTNDYDLIFMDIGLPDVDGLTVINTIRNSDDPSIAHTPIIVLSGHMNKTFRQECMEAGAQATVCKPLTSQLAQKLFTQIFSPTAPKLSLDTSENETPTELDQLPVIDLAYGAKILNNNETTAKELLVELFRLIKTEQPKLEILYKNNELKLLKALVHKLYGGLKYCGALRLCQAMQQLDHVLYSDPVDHKQLKLRFELVINEIQTFSLVYQEQNYLK